jgi:hypothetical protein
MIVVTLSERHQTSHLADRRLLGSYTLGPPYFIITCWPSGPSYREAKGGILRTADTGGWLRLLLVGCPFGFHNILLRMLRCKEHRATFCRGRHRRGRAVMDSYVEEKHVYILIFIATRERCSD